MQHNMEFSVITGESGSLYMRIIPEHRPHVEKFDLIDQEMCDKKIEAIRNAVSNIIREINRVYYNFSMYAEVKDIIPTIVDTNVDFVQCDDTTCKAVCTMIVKMQVIR